MIVAREIQPDSDGHQWIYCTKYNATDGSVVHYLECRISKDTVYDNLDGYMVYGYRFIDVVFPHNNTETIYIAPGLTRP